MHRQLLILLVCVALGTYCNRAPAADVEPGDRADDGALWQWERALGEFQRAGALIGEGEYEKARLLLGDCGRRLPKPYSQLAGERLEQLDAALGQGVVLGGYYRLGELGNVCLNLHAHAAAAELSRKAVLAHSADHYGHGKRIAWCLVESGDLEAGLAEYQKKLEQAKASDSQAYYREQIELLTARPENLNDPQFAVKYVFDRYLGGYGPPKDRFGALAEIKRVLPFAEKEQDKLELYGMFISLLSELDDEQGVLAWEERILREFAENEEACAEIYVQRGERAYEAEKLDLALANYRLASEKYSGASSYGVAQYNVGFLLQKQKKHQEAIAEFSKLYDSGVNDQDPGANLMETFRNYRHQAALGISECYEAERDFVRALQHAELARDKYKFQSWCGTCNAIAAANLAKRIERLQGLAK